MADEPGENDCNLISITGVKRIFPYLASAIEIIAKNKDGEITFRIGLTKYTIKYEYDSNTIMNEFDELLYTTDEN